MAIVLTTSVRLIAADNVLTDKERADGWILLFDGKTTKGWMTPKGQPLTDTHVQDGSLNPHPCDYMLVHEKVWENCRLSLDFKITPKCNSGIFIRTFPLTPRPGKDVGFNGLEIAVDDTSGAGFHDTGAIYDLVKPTKNAVKPAGAWNHIEITCDRNVIAVELNGEPVTRMDLDEWPEPNKRPDGSAHKFDVAYKTHPRKGFIGLQDHGSDCWYKNIKLLPLGSRLGESGTEEGFGSLFDGKTLAGWAGAKDAYKVEDGAIVCVQGTAGNLLTEKEFSDFVVRFEFKLTAGANNGLGIRCPMLAKGNLHIDGIELQILDNTAEKYKTLKPYQFHGSVYGIQPAKREFLKPLGEWNTQEVTVQGRKIKVVLNGETITDCDLDEATKNGTMDGVEHPGLNRTSGHLGFLGHGDRVDFRNIRIKDLSAKTGD